MFYDDCISSRQTNIVLVSEPTSFMDAYTFIKTAKLDHNINHFSIVVNMTENGKVENTFFKF